MLYFATLLPSTASSSVDLKYIYEVFWFESMLSNHDFVPVGTTHAIIELGFWGFGVLGFWGSR